jgi:poly(rC)-binding protein 2/3/4
MYSLSSLGLEGTGAGRYSSYGSLGSTNGAGGYGSLSSFSTSRSAAGGLPAGVPKSGSTVEVTIPNKSVGSILGRGGSNISQIREISGAKVKLHESKPGGTDRVVEISGTPEQTHAAQSLLQAFAMSGQNTRTARAL